MAPDQRRQALVSATVTLLLSQGVDLSTREIAAAAGVAEGTIFRAFDTKDDLIHAAVHAAMEPTEAIARMAALPNEQSMPERITALLSILIVEFQRTRALMSHLTASASTSRRMTIPRGTAHHPGGHGDARKRLIESAATALIPYHTELRVDAATVARLLIALTFAMGFDPTGTQHTSAESMTDVVLHGISEGIQ